ncbi:uncharacterized protein CLUP02_06271 [Colletotrichum lupini]|uniref:Uncharacterized protein n=1 Tax=Colletotrichum lupini TaxID=145971 RepID=A0A9Q8SPZ6_9PEZI|nr:uncharacterized protein CLUP02_06271 [Colletotrichum lupini]UQC80786.1 hypothetical protein CLUP02_06271 [Colletotrichum lupini]
MDPLFVVHLLGGNIFSLGTRATTTIAPFIRYYTEVSNMNDGRVGNRKPNKAEFHGRTHVKPKQFDLNILLFTYGYLSDRHGRFYQGPHFIDRGKTAAGQLAGEKKRDGPTTRHSVRFFTERNITNIVDIGFTQCVTYEQVDPVVLHVWAPASYRAYMSAMQYLALAHHSYDTSNKGTRCTQSLPESHVAVVYKSLFFCLDSAVLIPREAGVVIVEYQLRTGFLRSSAQQHYSVLRPKFTKHTTQPILAILARSGHRYTMLNTHEPGTKILGWNNGMARFQISDYSPTIAPESPKATQTAHEAPYPMNHHQVLNNKYLGRMVEGSNSSCRGPG